MLKVGKQELLLGDVHLTDVAHIHDGTLSYPHEHVGMFAELHGKCLLGVSEIHTKASLQFVGSNDVGVIPICFEVNDL